MARRAPASGLKKKVNPIWAIVALVAVVGIGVTFMFILPAIKNHGKTAEEKRIIDIVGPGIGAIKFAVQDMLGGVTLMPRKDSTGKKMVLTVTYIPPAAGSELQAGDVIASINKTKIESIDVKKAFLTLYDVPVGQTVSVGVMRDGQPTTAQVTRQELKKY